MFSSRSTLASVSQASLASVSQDRLASVSPDSLDRVWPSRRIMMNTDSPYRSLNTALLSSSSYYLKVAASRWIPLVLLWSSQVLYQASEAVSPKGGRINLITKSFYETAESKPKHEENFFGGFSSKTKNALFRRSKIVVLKTQISNLFFCVCFFM